MERQTTDHDGQRGGALTNLEDLVDDVDAVVWEADPRTFDFVFVNRRAVELLGYERAEWYEHDFWCGRLIHPDDRARTVATCRAAVAERRDHQVEYRALTADGQTVCLRDFIRVILGEDGEVQSLRGVMLDVTTEQAMKAEIERDRRQLVEMAREREATLDALRESESHYRRLVHASPFAVFVTDELGVVTEVNEGSSEILGYPADGMIGRHFSDFVAPEGLHQANANFAKIIAQAGRRVEIELTVRRPDEQRRLLTIAAVAIMKDGGVVGIHGIARDITDERATDSRRRLLAAALDNLPDAVSITDRQTRVRYTNRAHADLLGYDWDNAPADVETLLPDEESRGQLREIYDALQRDRRWSGRMRRKRADGSTIVVSATMFAVSDGSDDYALTVMRDASIEISRNQHLRRVERLASLGTLIGGVAHELNNPLTAVVGFAHLMLLDERPEEDRDTLETMAREAERAARIVSDLRLVARNTQENGGSDREPVDLNDVVRHVLKVRRYSIETRGIRIVEQLGGNVPPVRANRAQIEQVVMNVLVNAEQALDRHPGAERVITVRTESCSRGAALYIADNGPGIRGDYLDRIFDPFFTTKPPGEGTGLGLSLVHSIVTEHGGSMRVESAPDEGAEFVIELPLATTDTEAEESVARLTQHPRAARSLNVLVVDDEASIRELLARALTRRGHTVIEARDGGEALRLLDDLKISIDVIASDIRMPGLGGDQLLARLRAARTDLAERVVFITGDAVTAGPGAPAIAGMPVLHKPFQLDEAAALIEARAAAQDSTSSSS